MASFACKTDVESEIKRVRYANTHYTVLTSNDSDQIVVFTDLDISASLDSESRDRGALASDDSRESGSWQTSP
jgi:hypothetical protein